MKPNILIAVPAYGGSVKVECMMSVIGALIAFHQHGANCSVLPIDRHDIGTVRDYYASIVVQDSAFSHVLFLDNDMEIRGSALVRLLTANKPVIGIAAPLRETPPKFNVNLRPDRTTIEGGIASVDRIGAAALLVSRTALLKLIASGSVTADGAYEKRYGLRGPLYDFFYSHDRERTGEDHEFCRKWRRLGEEVYAIVDEPVGHVGSYNYRGRLIDHLQAETVTEKSSQTPNRQHMQRR